MGEAKDTQDDPHIDHHTNHPNPQPTHHTTPPATAPPQGGLLSGKELDFAHMTDPVVCLLSSFCSEMEQVNVV